MDVFTRIREQMAGLTVDGTFPAAVEAAIEEQMPVPPPEPIEQSYYFKKQRFRGSPLCRLNRRRLLRKCRMRGVIPCTVADTGNPFDD
jgi:hypothetical protein